MKKLPWKRSYFVIALSLLAAISFKYCVNVTDEALTYTNSAVSFLFCVCLSYALKRITEDREWEKTASVLNPCFVFAFCFWGSMTAGVRLDNYGEVNFADWRMWFAALFVALATAPILGWVVKSLESYGKRQKRDSRESGERQTKGRKYFYLVWGILFLAYMLPFLASFPGFFTYDAETEVYMVFTEKYSAHHPMLHVVLLGWLIRIFYHVTKSYNAGIACYILVQMAVLSACFAYMMNFLYKIAGVRRWICNLGTGFLALFPTVSMFVCCSTKDSMFSGGVVLLTTLLLEMAGDAEGFWEKRSKKVWLIVSIFLILSFRNNGVYALVLLFIPFYFLYRKIWRKWFIPILTAVIVFCVTTGVIGKVFHFVPGEIAEMLCVPMQQLARTYVQAEDSFTEEELETLFTLIPESILKNYSPKLADNVKVNFLEDNFKNSPGKYISLWATVGLRHPDIYVNSFLMNTYGYWYPDTVPDGYRGKTIYRLEYEDSSYFAFETEPPGERVHLLPALENFYKKCSLEIYQQKLPVVSMLFSMGFWHWCYAFLALYLVLSGYRRHAFAFALTGLIYLTVLPGPIALVRYVLYFFFLAPLVPALLFDTEAVCGG